MHGARERRELIGEVVLGLRPTSWQGPALIGLHILVVIGAAGRSLGGTDAVSERLARSSSAIPLGG